MSHTVEVKIELRNKQALAAAVERLNGKVLGEGTYSFGGSQNSGFGFKLPNWRHPLVLGQDHKLRFDDYHGQWGNRADLKTLEDAYTSETVIEKCVELGWLTQREDNGNVTVYHPSGGSIVVELGGKVEGFNFHGTGCDAAIEAITSALGTETARYCKTERNEQKQEATILGN